MLPARQWPNGIEPVLYFRFDTLRNVKLKEGSQDGHFSPLVAGKVRTFAHCKLCSFEVDITLQIGIFILFKFYIQVSTQKLWFWVAECRLLLVFIIIGKQSPHARPHSQTMDWSGRSIWSLYHPPWHLWTRWWRCQFLVEPYWLSILGRNHLVKNLPRRRGIQYLLCQQHLYEVS